MSNYQRPILYSFRRCPYAIRARLALYYSGVVCELREVVLKSKPPSLLAVSPKGTVPVLLVSEQANDECLVIEQSIDVVDWALKQSDTDNWLEQKCDHPLISSCDNEFKAWLDRYKYADRFPEHPQDHYFKQACEFLNVLEESLVPAQVSSSRLAKNDEQAISFSLLTPKLSVLDIAIFPFVRQFAFVDKAAFDSLELPKVQSWLNYFLSSSIFSSVMEKYPMWVENESELLLFGQKTN